MPMLAVRVLRKISLGLNPGMKYLLRPKRKKVIDSKQVAERIAETSAFSRGDVYGILTQYETILKWELLEGNPVKLGEIGTISPEFSAKAVDTLEEANLSTIKRKFIRLRSSLDMRDSFAKMPIEIDSYEDIKGLQINNSDTPVEAP